MNKGKQQRDRRKLREKRRSTGVVHMPSTEVSVSTPGPGGRGGGSGGKSNGVGVGEGIGAAFD